MARPSQRETILDAAEKVVISCGAAHLTLDAVGEEAGVKRGGLIYHFPSKKALLQALIDRTIRLYGERMALALADPKVRGNQLLGHIRALANSGEHLEQLATSIIAIAANAPEMIQSLDAPYKARAAALMRQSEHGMQALMVILAIDGLYLLERLGIHPLKKADRRRFLRFLIEQSKDNHAQMVLPSKRRGRG